MELPYDPAIPMPEHISGKGKNSDLELYMHHK